jgi:uncharacterized protein (DUF2147 family)
MITFLSLVASALAKDSTPVCGDEAFKGKTRLSPTSVKSSSIRLAVTNALVVPLLLVGTASQAALGTADIKGDWILEDGSAVTRVAPCAREQTRLCATVIQEVLAPGDESSLGQVVVHDIRQTKPGQFSGQYQVGPQKLLPATIKVRGPNALEMKVCMSIFCDTIKLVRKTS